jgi:hypothetical protein
MPRGGSKPGERRGGRQKGTPNKKTANVQEKLDKLGCDPIEGMARIAIEAMEIKDYQLAGNMLKELAQYVAPKRKAMEVSGSEDGGPIRITWKS